MYDIHMKTVKWSQEKNQKLLRSRGVCFEDVIVAIKEGRLLDTVKHPNWENYPNQFLYIVKIQGYVYMVPFVEETEYIFLKTVIPSRKHTKRYLKND
jgi:hypothetical protein